VTFFLGRPELLRAFREGDRAVVADVYWAYVDLVERVVHRAFQRAGGRGVPAEEVADLVQEVFVRAFRERARLAYDGLREYRPFLGTVARNVVTDWARRRGRALVELPEELEAQPTDDAEPGWADEEVVRATEAYLAGLPVELAGVHQQRFVLGNSQLEAARQLGFTRQQVRTLEGKLRDGLALALRKAGLLERARAG
jgi:RNA polymerase sigma-70 factor (ECF subfamily)